jgi:hypothetical protein
MNEHERRERDRERHSRIMRELRRPLTPVNPWLMWEQELAALLPTRPKLAAIIAARKVEWEKRLKQTISIDERERLAQVLSSGAGRHYGLARFLRARG